MSDGRRKGERKVATVLFAEIVDSAALVADVDPEEANERLLPWLQAMADAVDEHRGVVCQLLGDGIIAIFDASAGQENHALSACLAAADIQSRFARTNAPGGQGWPSPVRFRVGISTGIIFVHPIPTGIVTSLRIVGEPVYLASRALDAADPGQILLTAETYALVDGLVAARPGKTIHLREPPGAVETFVLGSQRRDGAGRGPA